MYTYICIMMNNDNNNKKKKKNKSNLPGGEAQGAVRKTACLSCTRPRRAKTSRKEWRLGRQDLTADSWRPFCRWTAMCPVDDPFIGYPSAIGLIICLSVSRPSRTRPRRPVFEKMGPAPLWPEPAAEPK